MITSFRFKNWKSFEEADLSIDPLTVLIGTNASGKSNALDAIQFLYRAAIGKDFFSALSGDSTIQPLRGGVEWAARVGSDTFGLEVSVSPSANDSIEYHYSIEIQLSPRPQLKSETLTRTKSRSSRSVQLFWSDLMGDEQPSAIYRLYNGKSGTKREGRRDQSILFQLAALPSRAEVEAGVKAVLGDLQSIFILDPIPTRMRSYSTLSDRLQSDASNIAGVLAALDPARQASIEEILSTYVSQLPESEIRRVFAEKVGRFESDAMLYCEEYWSDQEQRITIDARGMSDGTLRFISIIIALLTRPASSLLVIEEVDNGLHPSRASLLLKMLNDLASSRKVDVLITTHNPALLDALTPDFVPFVFVSYRDEDDGSTAIKALDDFDELSRLLASGPIGQLATSGTLEKAAKQS